MAIRLGHWIKLMVERKIMKCEEYKAYERKEQVKDAMDILRQTRRYVYLIAGY